jgi:hypothetical protein
MRTLLIAAMVFALSVGVSGCGKDDKNSAARDAEVQKRIQEGMQKEKQMYEGMQKGAENLEKKSPEQKPETKK